MEDLYWEHQQHYSDEWKDLSDRCSECYKMCKKYGNGVIAGVSFKRQLEALEDLAINKNPLEVPRFR